MSLSVAAAPEFLKPTHNLLGFCNTFFALSTCVPLAAARSILELDATPLSYIDIVTSEPFRLSRSWNAIKHHYVISLIQLFEWGILSSLAIVYVTTLHSAAACSLL